MGQSGLQCSETKPLQQDPDTLTQKGEQQKEWNAGQGGDKVTRDEKMEKGRERAVGECLCGSSLSPKNAGVLSCHCQFTLIFLIIYDIMSQIPALRAQVYSSSHLYCNFTLTNCHTGRY